MIHARTLHHVRAPRVRMAVVSDVVAADLGGLARQSVERDDQSSADALAAAIRSELRRDVAGSWRRFASHVQAVLGDQAAASDATIVASLLFVLATEPACLSSEPRFVDLAARVRAYPRIGEYARGVLEAIPLAEAIAAVERYPRRAPRVTRGALPERRDMLVRYCAGEHAVWAELVGLAAAISLHVELRDVACDVATELMARAAARADAIGAAREPDGVAREAAIARLAASVGPLPISIAACLRAGGVTLPDSAALAALLDGYDARIATSHREIVGPLVVPLAPPPHDTGDAPCIELPALGLADAVDPVVRGTGMRFVDHLRGVLGGGF
jgi:hypothetical protein